MININIGEYNPIRIVDYTGWFFRSWMIMAPLLPPRREWSGKHPAPGCGYPLAIRHGTGNLPVATLD
jgi:hypothetical protein